MKSNLNITLVLLATSLNAFAGPTASLLSTASKKVYWETAELTKMTPSALNEYQSFRNYARDVVDQTAKNSGKPMKEAYDIAKGLTSSLNHDRDLTVLKPGTNGRGENSALLQQMSIDKTGQMVRSGFEIPPTHEVPMSISLTSPSISMGGTVNDVVAVKRTFDLPSSENGKLDLENMMAVKEIDGRNYRMILQTEVTVGNNVTKASIVGMSAGSFQPREIQINLRTKNPNNTFTYSYNVSGTFKLPEDIKGQVVDLNINAMGTRLTFKTTEGIEYTYSIQKDPTKTSSYDRDYNAFKFTQISKSKIPGGVNSPLASVKVYPGRASSTKPVKGMEVESAGGSGAGVK